MKKVTTHITTQESEATAPARLLAQQAIADFSDRKLAYFHWREAQELLSALEHEVRDYDDELSSFEERTARGIASAVDKIAIHLDLVKGISIESAKRVRTALAKKGGAS